MKVRKIVITLLFLLLTAVQVQADVEAYIGDLNVYASRRFGDFKADLSARFGVSGSRFDLLLRQVDSPGDLAVALWLGSEASRPVEEVVKQYRRHRGKGWGTLAKALGIRPGSSAFHRLKAGEIGWYPREFSDVLPNAEKQRGPGKKAKKNRHKKK